MKKLIPLSIIAILFLAISAFIQPDSALAESDNNFKSYVKFDGVDGESMDAKHIKWSDLLSFTQGYTKPGAGMTGQSRRRGAVVVEDIVLVKELDKASPKIAEAITKGRVYPKVDIAVTYDNRDLYAYELKNVIVTSYTISYQGGMPVEEISIIFEELTSTYSEYDKTGKLKGKVEYTYKAEKGE